MGVTPARRYAVAHALRKRSDRLDRQALELAEELPDDLAALDAAGEWRALQERLSDLLNDMAAADRAFADHLLEDE